MDVKKLKCKKRIKNIKCIPACIRHCNGFVIETTTVQPDRKNIFDLMEELADIHGYHIYSLRHKCSDWTEPRYITQKGILFDRFGWFLSKDKMKFKDLSDEIRITSSNSVFYDVSTDGVYEESRVWNCKEIKVLDYFSLEDEIFN